MLDSCTAKKKKYSISIFNLYFFIIVLLYSFEIKYCENLQEWIGHGLLDLHIILKNNFEIFSAFEHV